jgi:hypothetical protein
MGIGYPQNSSDELREEREVHDPEHFTDSWAS